MWLTMNSWGREMYNTVPCSWGMNIVNAGRGLNVDKCRGKCELNKILMAHPVHLANQLNAFIQNV